MEANTIKLILKNELPQEILNTNVYLSLDLSATKLDYMTGVTVLNIALPKKGKDWISV